MYSEPDRTSTVYRWYQKGDEVNCIKDSYVYVTNPNGRYTACGVENANGWIRVKLNQNGNSYSPAYVYMTCVKDV